MFFRERIYLCPYFPSLILGFTAASASAAILNFDRDDFITAGRDLFTASGIHGYTFESYPLGNLPSSGPVRESQIYSGTGSGPLDFGVSVNGLRRGSSSLVLTDIAIYDTNIGDAGSSGSDTDLQRNVEGNGARSGWAGGNLGEVEPNFDAGGAVIIPANNSRVGNSPGDYAHASGTFSAPDDHQEGGWVIFDIAPSKDYRYFNLDIVDFEEQGDLTIVSDGRGDAPDRTFIFTQNSIKVYDGLFNNDPNDLIRTFSRTFKGKDGGISRLQGPFDGGGNIEQLIVSFDDVSGAVGRLELSSDPITIVPEVSSVLPLLGLLVSCSFFGLRAEKG